MPLRRGLYLAGAALCFWAALFIVLAAGLPERAQFSGQILADGLVMAPELNALAPRFMLTTLAGDFIDLERLRGSTVIINFWATWCEPCRIEMPILQAFYEARPDSVRILAVNLGESPEAVGAWVNEFGLTFDILLDPQQTVAALYQLRGQPSTYVLTAGGIISAIFYGPVTAQQLQAVSP